MRRLYCGPARGLFTYGEFLKFMESCNDTFCLARSAQECRQSWYIGKMKLLYQFGRQHPGEVEITAFGAPKEVEGVERLIHEAEIRMLSGAGSLEESKYPYHF